MDNMSWKYVDMWNVDEAAKTFIAAVEYCDTYLDEDDSIETDNLKHLEWIVVIGTDVVVTGTEAECMARFDQCCEGMYAYTNSIDQITEEACDRLSLWALYVKDWQTEQLYALDGEIYNTNIF